MTTSGDMTARELAQIFEPGVQITQVREVIASADITYYGWTSHRDPNPADAEWFIVKKYVSGSQDIYARVDGTDGQESVWNDYSSLTYE